MVREGKLTVPTEHGFERKGGRDVLDADGTIVKGAEGEFRLLECDAVGRLAREPRLVAAASSRPVLSLAGTLDRSPVACTKREAVIVGKIR